MPVHTPDITVTQSDPPEDIATLFNKSIAFCHKAKLHYIEGDFDQGLSALDKAYSALLLIHEEDTPVELSRQKENLRYLISKRILEIHASLNNNDIGSHASIPMIMNRQVMTEIKVLTKGGDDSFFSKAYKRSGIYHDIIFKELNTAGLPEELFWLPLIESGFRVDALSPARALGLWQFIPSTGYKFGLKRDHYIDERLDPVKSTKAAVAYLSELHDLFGDWSTALAAYNCGEKTVLKLIQEQHISYLDNFWDLYDRLPRETQRYVARFIATLHIVNNPGKYGIKSPVMDRPVRYETIQVEKRVTLKDIAGKIGTAEDTMKFLNPELRYGILPESAYDLKIPLNKKQLLTQNIHSIAITPPPTAYFVYYKVKKGDTLTSIARRYKTNLSKIISINHIRNNHIIEIGTVLKIPRKRSLNRISWEHVSTDT